MVKKSWSKLVLPNIIGILIISSTSRASATKGRKCFFFLLFLFTLFADLPSLCALSFDYPDFREHKNLNLSGDASPARGVVIALTKNEAFDDLSNSIGRAVYSEELHIWDRATSKMADFFTYFAFSVSVDPEAEYRGDGLALFLAPNGSSIPVDSGGGCLGLITNCTYLNTSRKALVAVEFDSYKNEWDPSHNHVGINVNSIISNATRNTSNSTVLAAKALITYNSQARNLSLFMTYLDNSNLEGSLSLSYEINLSQYLPEWVSVGFSSSTGNNTAVHNLISWKFNSTDLDGDSKRSNLALIVGCVVGGFIVIGTTTTILFFCWRSKRKKQHVATVDDSMNLEFEQGIGPKRFSYSELAKATNNFSEEGKLGEGGFGGVYRGCLSECNSIVAVKRVSRRSKQGKKEYMSEVNIISRLRHKNIVQLVGWCHENGDLLLIYEFMPNGSLDSHLFKEDQSILSWEVRYRIALGLASALLYLHEEWEQCVVHRDIKPSNVMLDSKLNTKLGDFGLARIMDHELGSKTTALAGTFGYMAPEYINTGKASKGSDVFSFGIVTLEIACGRRSMQAVNEEAHISLVELVWELYGNGRILDGADKRLNMDFDKQQMERLLTIGLWCAHPDYRNRPSIRQALQVLNLEASLPDLPLKMPVPNYDTSNFTEPLVSSISVSITGR